MVVEEGHEASSYGVVPWCYSSLPYPKNSGGTGM